MIAFVNFLINYFEEAFIKSFLSGNFLYVLYVVYFINYTNVMRGNYL